VIALWPTGRADAPVTRMEQRMNSIIWWVGLVVIVLFILGWLGLA
jgi:hypothetical protein